MFKYYSILLFLLILAGCKKTQLTDDVRREMDRLYNSSIPYLNVKQDSALLYLDSLEMLLDKEYDDEFYTKNLIFRANIAFGREEYGLADSIHNALKNQFENYENPELEAYTYLARANQFEQQDKHLDASYLYEDVLNLIDTTFRNHQIFEAVTLQNSGLCYKNLYELDKAYQYLIKADSIYESVGTNKRRFNVYNNLGIMFRTNRQYDKAKKYHSKALEIAHIDGTKNVSRSLYNIALIYQNEEKCDSALILLDSIIANPHLSKRKNLLLTHLLSFRCQLDNGDISTAMQHLDSYKKMVIQKAVPPNEDIDALWFFLKGRDHGQARIKNMSKEEKALMVSKLEKWLDLEIDQD